MFKWLKRKLHALGRSVKATGRAVKKAQPGNWLKGAATAPKGTALRKITGKYWLDEIGLAATGQWAGLGGDVVANIVIDERNKAIRKREKVTEKEIQNRTAERLQQYNVDESLQSSKISTDNNFDFSKIIFVAGGLLIFLLMKNKKR